MNDKALKALKESIAHWERMRDGTCSFEEEPCANDCALCEEFWENDDCVGCPVAAATGRGECSGSPYNRARYAWDYQGNDSKEFKEAAQAEIDFLKSLLPQG